MSPPAQTTISSTVLLVFLTYVPFLLSVLSFYPELFAAHPLQYFFLGLTPWWLTYLSGRWYVRLAEKSSPLYSPLGCLAQCYVWVFHWVVSLYHACFVNKYTLWTYLFTVFCVGIAVIAEGLFYGLITMGLPETANLGTYGTVRKLYGQGLVFVVRVWYMVDTETLLEQQSGNRRNRTTQSRSMTM